MAPCAGRLGRVNAGEDGVSGRGRLFGREDGNSELETLIVRCGTVTCDFARSCTRRGVPWGSSPSRPEWGGGGSQSGYTGNRTQRPCDGGVGEWGQPERGVSHRLTQASFPHFSFLKVSN